ncbi:hypothetical protein LLY42_05160 [Pseudomonas frederiksbergensis]|uniref:Uncharacterized protein n=1 Tax=Pseudomonas cucumis TaxID=2954082 RepID=A0ABY9EWK0_9PSED|nr:hypothetical protein [Pseudomonas cucumis]URM29012.1 hypothetical protein LLY42_05160 [Pseudomonas frederiksbergensis]WLG84894.1 hypothetical protein PSH97_28130 [Pseudomonas cucumis]
MRSIKYVEDFDALEDKRYEPGEMLVTPHMTFVTTSPSNSLGMSIGMVRFEEGFNEKGLLSDNHSHFGPGDLIVTFRYPRIKGFEFAFHGYNAHRYVCKCFDQGGQLINELPLKTDEAHFVRYERGEEEGYISRLEINFWSDGAYMAVDLFSIWKEE